MNPSNVVTLTGMIQGTPTFIKDNSGVEFCMIGTLSIRRNFKNNNGVYDYDYVPFRIVGENRMKFARMLNSGSLITLTGSVHSYKSNPDLKYNDSLYILAENVQFTPQLHEQPLNTQGSNSLPYTIS